MGRVAALAQSQAAVAVDDPDELAAGGTVHPTIEARPVTQLLGHHQLSPTGALHGVEGVS